MIYYKSSNGRQKKHTKIRGGASRYILGVSSFLFSMIGGVERGESTGRREHDRDIRE